MPLNGAFNMRATTLALLALGLASTSYVAPAAAAPVSIKTTGFLAGTDGLNLFGLGQNIGFEAFEIEYFFKEGAGTRQHFSYYNGSGFPGPPPPPQFLFAVETHDRFLDSDATSPHAKVILTIANRSLGFEANSLFSAEVIDYFRAADPTDRVFNLEAHARGGPSPYFSVDLSQILLQPARLPPIGTAITGPLPPTLVTAPYFANGAPGNTGNQGSFRAQRCFTIGVDCQETLLNFFFTSSITVARVPEAPTWGMLLMGFGVTGYALRRRPKLAKRRAQV
jgi:hypothetical protein